MVCHVSFVRMAALDGRAVVIVGGTSGLGLSAALACIREGAGVVVSGRSDDNLSVAAKQLGDRAQVMDADAANSNSAPTLIDACLNRFGRFDALYHVAGGSGRKMGDGPLHEITDEGWLATIALNQTSQYNRPRGMPNVPRSKDARFDFVDRQRSGGFTVSRVLQHARVRRAL